MISQDLLPFLITFIIILFSSYAYFRRRNLGDLDIDTEDVAYDHQKFSHILKWDKHCFYIHGKPTLILSGEFHYWRLPVSYIRSFVGSFTLGIHFKAIQSRRFYFTYLSIGLNCIRIYFHWGFHSPNEATYYFDGNRDVNFLLDLCEKHHLYVMCAPGPYICAETQGGGIPYWVIAKRHVRLRHSVNSLFRRFDHEYAKYSSEWYMALIPHISKHQITEKKNGCVIAFQIENESFETIRGIPLGVADDMKILCNTARDMGINVPLFTNDAFEEGSFITRDLSYRVFGKK
jgi:beta-galactosidase GanA